jgi:hypothetical protein
MTGSITHITRTFLDPDGSVTSEETIEVANFNIEHAAVNFAELARTDLNVAVRRLIKMIRNCDPATRPMLKALHGEGRSKATFQSLADVKTFSDKARIAFLAIWTECGHHIRREVADDVVVLDALRRLLPAYDGPSVCLFRGEPWEDYSIQHHGICWSSDVGVAELYARGLNAMTGGGGVLIETTAPTEAIICKAVTTGATGWEFEYVVDRRRLGEIRQLVRFPEAF